ncbi:YraN family protein [Corynebacterium cystitidis]|uniref:YraN family protein n=1 Tax=Corynebacterium cystitidis TaxID=35757 RepID=UPI00211E0425|nr:YraN family protein [Corynebacterium cystitidis]
MTTTRISLARRGELAAADFYERRGATVLARNVYYTFGELDLIVRETDGTVVFVEVKTRSGLGYGNAESVTQRKLDRMRRAALRWLMDKPYAPVRFDVLALNVVGDTFAVELFEGVDDGAC